MSQLDIFTIEREDSGKTVELQWLDPRELSPHPSNPRRGVPAKLEAYTRSMKEEGYRPDKPMLVRPYEDSYQIIGGHSRQQAAINAGLDKVLCCIEHMDDDEAVLRLASDNLNDPFPWYSNALYIVENAVKDSKKGLSRTALVKAATGKEDNAAKHEGARLAEAGEVIQHLEQSATGGRLLSELLDPDRSLTMHLVAIHKAPKREWIWLVEQLLKNEWGRRDTEAASKAISQLCSIPENFHHWLNPEKWKKEAIKDNAIAKDIARFVATAEGCLGNLKESTTVWQFKDGEPYRETVSPQRMFLERLSATGHPSDKKIVNTASQVHAWLEELEREYKSWQDRQASEDEANRQQAEKEKQRLEFIRLYTPDGHNEDLRDMELEPDSIDAVITDPPYLLSNGGNTVRSGKAVKVDKNFEDTDGDAIAPSEWVPILFDALKPGGYLIATCSRHIYFEIAAECDRLGMNRRNDSIWYKRNAPPAFQPETVQHMYEFIVIAQKPGSVNNPRKTEYKEKYGSAATNLFDIPQCGGSERLGWHDTQKPIELAERLTLLYTSPGDLVLDPFAGSGTFTAAAKSMDRRSIWIEKKPEFFSKTERRLAEIPLSINK